MEQQVTDDIRVVMVAGRRKVTDSPSAAFVSRQARGDQTRHDRCKRVCVFCLQVRRDNQPHGHSRNKQRAWDSRSLARRRRRGVAKGGELAIDGKGLHCGRHRRCLYSHCVVSFFKIYG